MTNLIDYNLIAQVSRAYEDKGFKRTSCIINSTSYWLGSSNRINISCNIDPSTVTLSVLGETVAQMIKDLMAQGILK